MTNWTKGPWRVLEGKYGLQIFSAKHWIANIKCESCPAHEEANARIIAAAPKLYEVLDGIVKELMHDCPSNLKPELRDAIAALSEARGEAQ